MSVHVVFCFAFCVFIHTSEHEGDKILIPAMVFFMSLS